MSATDDTPGGSSPDRAGPTTTYAGETGGDPGAARMLRAKRPLTALAGPYGHPLHPALVALPIGAWVASLVFDLATLAVPDPQPLAEAARWLIGLGVLGASAAATVGFLDLFAVPAGTRAFRTALVHMSLALAGTGLYLAGFLLRGDPPDAPVAAGPLALSVVALALVGVAGYLGGTLAYRYGVRVADEATQLTGFDGTGRAPGTGSDHGSDTDTGPAGGTPPTHRSPDR